MKLSKSDRFFIITSLIFMSGAFLPLTSNDTGNIEGGGILTQFVFALIYIFSIVKLYNINVRLKSTITLSKPLLLLISLSIISVIWSDEPFYTARRVIGLVGTSLFGYYISITCDIDLICKLLFKSLLITLIGSFIISIFLPSYGLMGANVENGLYTGAWKGVFAHKNNLGATMDLFIIVCFYLYTLKRNIKFIISILLAFALIFFARSTTALILPVLIISIFYTLRITKFRILNISLLSISLAYILVIVFFDTGKIFDLIGKDATFTGRTFLWLGVISAIGKHPILGFGYGAFWISGKNNMAAKIWADINWDAPHAHNGFLDLILQLGYVGLCIYLVLFFKKYGQYLYRYTVNLKDEYAWGGLFMTLILVYNFMESNILRQNNIFWCLFIFTIIRYRMIELKKVSL